MTITELTPSPELTLKLAGRLDTVTAPKAEADILAAIVNANTLTLDISELDYMSSAGLRVMLMLHKTMAKKGGFTLKNPNEMVTEVLEITGMSEVLHIELAK